MALSDKFRTQVRHVPEWAGALVFFAVHWDHSLQETAMAKQVKDQDARKKDVMDRMKRIEGQVRGIQRMIEEGKECEDILTQMRAVRSALRSVSTQIMRRYLQRCVELNANSSDPKVHYDKLLMILSNFIDG